MSAELQPSPHNREVTSVPFIRDVLKAKELETEEKREKYYYQMGYLYASGILEKVYEWADFKEDSRVLTSEDTSGRYVISVQWNFREQKGRKLCDEVGVAFIGEIAETPLLKYDAIYYGEDGEPDKQRYEEYKESADFFLVWGQKPKIVRYFPHGKVEEGLNKLSGRDEKSEGGWKNIDVWDRMMVRDDLGPLKLFDAVDHKNTEEEVKAARIASGKKFEQTLIRALNSPKLRQKPSSAIRSPFKGDFGENSMQLFGGFESKIRRIELRDRIEEDRRLHSYRGGQTTSEKATAALTSGAGYSYEEMLEQQLMEEIWDEEDEESYSTQMEHPQEDCHFDYEAQQWDHGEFCEDAPMGD